MKKAAKGIIGLCAVLAVLGGGLAVLKLTEPEDTSESSSESSEVSGAGITLLKDEEISEVKLTNTVDSFNIITKTEASEDSAATYTIEGYDDVPLTTSMVGTIPNNAKGLVSNEIVAENCTDTAKYGFDSPQATAEILYESGETVKVYIGDTTPVSSNTYFMIDGDDTVYTISTSEIANYLSDVNSFISSTILEEPDEDSYPTVNSLRIQRNDIDYDIYLEYDPKSDDASYTGGTTATHIMVEPTSAYLSVERSTAITNGLFGLTSKAIYSVHPGEAEIAEAGLSDPFCTVTMSCDDGNTYVFLMSEPFVDESGSKSHYAMFEGGNIIYTVSADDASWGTIMPIDIASKIFMGSYVWNVTDFKIKCQNADECEFKISMKDSVTDTSSLKSDDFNVTKNGATFDAERYRSFYSFMISAAAEDFALNEAIPDSEPLVSIEYTDSYTGEVQKVDFYDYSALNALIVINGESKYFCSKSYVETVVENVNRIDTGEDYITTWR